MALLASTQEMVFSSSLPEARHYVENLLAAFCHWISVGNSTELAGLIRGIRTTRSGAGGTLTPVTAEGLLAVFSEGTHGSIVTTSGLSVHRDSRSVHYSCTYQIWDAGAPPFCRGYGTFRGRLQAGHQVWRWTDLDVAEGSEWNLPEMPAISQNRFVEASKTTAGAW